MVDAPRAIVVKLDLGIEPETGAPMPFVLASEREVNIVFYGSREVSEHPSEECVAIASFDGHQIIRFGGPNDEAIEGHPLYKNGLESYGIFEVVNSSAVVQLEAENRVHFPKSDYSDVRHFIITFHVSMYEGAGDLTITVSDKSYKDTIRMVVEKMLTR